MEKDQSVWRRKFRAAERAAPGARPRAFFLTDAVRTPNPISVVQELPPGWGVIYRHFGDVDRRDMAFKLARLSCRRRLLFLIAADPELAFETGAAGVHWPEAMASESRKWRYKFALMTASAHSRRALAVLENLPIDVALVSSVFPSNSASAGPPLGPVRFRKLIKSHHIQTVALGGVSALRVAQLDGQCGFASIEGLSKAFGP